VIEKKIQRAESLNVHLCCYGCLRRSTNIFADSLGVHFTILGGEVEADLGLLWQTAYKSRNTAPSFPWETFLQFPDSGAIVACRRWTNMRQVRMTRIDENGARVYTEGEAGGCKNRAGGIVPVVPGLSRRRFRVGEPRPSMAGHPPTGWEAGASKLIRRSPDF